MLGLALEIIVNSLDKIIEKAQMIRFYYDFLPFIFKINLFNFSLSISVRLS